MNIIVPLAGPDFVAPTGLVKGMSQLLGQPLLKAVLESRPWHSPVNNYYFIYQDLAECRVFHFENVRRWFPRSEAVFIGGFTQGAALTALIGVSALKSFDEPMVVDLADIYSKPHRTVLLTSTDRFILRPLRQYSPQRQILTVI